MSASPPITYRQPAFTADEACRLAARRFGVKADARPLPSERDQNFLLDAGGEGRLVLKIAHAGEDRAILELQNRAMERISEREPDVRVPRVRRAPDGADIVVAPGAGGEEHLVRLLSFVPGTVFAESRPHTPALLLSLGETIGRIARGLASLDHPAAHRALKWDLSRAGWIREYLPRIPDPARRALVTRCLDRYEADALPLLPSLRHQTIYNDANDYNVLVDGARPEERRAVGLIDFGDLVHAPLVCEPAIAAAYACFGKPDPLAAITEVVAGFHAMLPLEEREIELLDLLVSVRLCVSVTNAAVQRAAAPENRYLTISEAPAWEALERLAALPPRLARYAMRDACGLSGCPSAPAVAAWLGGPEADPGPLVDADLSESNVTVLDLSVGSPLLDDLRVLDDPAAFSRCIGAALVARGATVGIGRYDEPRLLYTTDAFRTEGNEGPEWRTVHLGLDLFAPAGTRVLAPLAGVVHAVRDNAVPRDYGPTVILRHELPGVPVFYSLYGHLARAGHSDLRAGQAIAAGTPVGRIGEVGENGGWPPHLHFQLITDLLGEAGNFPGVAAPRVRRLWQSLSPDPNLVARIPAARFPAAPASPAEILAARSRRLGPSLSISYRRPLEIVRGWMQYLIDHEGRRFLDAVNNVPHVGHSHPRVVEAGRRQMAVLNTNTRYLHEHVVRYAERLGATLPPSLSVCFFVNSGSEANELALRLARAATGRRGMVVVDVAYHGNTTTLIDISPYKHDGPGGSGPPSWVKKIPMPDPYRGPHRQGESDLGQRYAAYIPEALAALRAAGEEPAGFICESILSCGGQIVLPDGFLAAAYDHVRRAGGVCIADEVQVGFGRVGTHFWAFETQGVVPDIVTLGKPIGNGHPLGAVVTTPAIAAAFANGMEFFSTFGGNPVSCAIGLAVLDVIRDEGLQEQARRVGEHLLSGLRGLAQGHPLVGDARGLGLFVGVELVRDRATLEPAGEEASWVANRMRDAGILVSTDGPFHNVLKIKPPLCFTADDADRLVATLDRVLGEDVLRSSR